MQIKIDCHFHPGLPRNEEQALIKCQGWWQALHRQGINGVLVTEHIFKNPKSAYILMVKTRPAHCFVFPGLEYLTRDGLDLIIFSDSPDFYDFPELRRNTLDFWSTLEFVKQRGLFAFLPHPYSIADSAVIKARGKNFYKRALAKLGAVEVVNTGYDELLWVLDRTILRSVFNQTVANLKKTRRLPQADYPTRPKFLVAGSDAHSFETLGSYVAMDSIDPLTDLVNGRSRVCFARDFNQVRGLRAAGIGLTFLFLIIREGIEKRIWLRS